MWRSGKLHGAAQFNKDGGASWAPLSLLRDLLDQAAMLPIHVPRAPVEPDVRASAPMPVAVVHMDPRPGNQSLLYESRKKSGWVAALLNLLLPGVGYMYCGNVVLGIVAFVFAVFLLVITLGLAAPIIVLILVVDGFLCADRHNRKLVNQLVSGQRLAR
jgi:TM2 domain-containing membrane protein YozV